MIGEAYSAICEATLNRQSIVSTMISGTLRVKDDWPDCSTSPARDIA